MSRTRLIAKANDALIRLIALIFIGCALAAVTGRLSVHTVNDTASYINYPFDSLSDALLSTRTPGYPAFLAIATATIGLSVVPLLQVLLHATASWFLGEELLRRSMPIGAAMTAAFCLLVGCTATDHINTISTDAPAASLGVITSAFLMRTCRTGSLRDALFCAAFALLTIFVRPAYLFLIPWIATAGWLLVRRQNLSKTDTSADHAQPWTGLKISFAISLVVLAWMGTRKAVVSDFGIVPFGHQNLSAVLVQLVPTDTLRELPRPAAELGTMVADDLERQGFELPQKNGGGIPTLTLESQWGRINYGVIWPIARDAFADQDSLDVVPTPVLIHNRIGALNFAILRAAPDRYVRWLLLATRRAVWGTLANIAMHPVFLAMILVGCLRLVWRASHNTALGPINVPGGWGSYALVAVSYAVFSIGFVILSSPPIGRFADAGAIFIPGLIATLFVSSHTDN